MSLFPRLSKSESNSDSDRNKDQAFRVSFRRKRQTNSGISETEGEEGSIHLERDVQESAVSFNLQNCGGFRLWSLGPSPQNQKLRLGLIR